MSVHDFAIAALPRIDFGSGALLRSVGYALAHGRNILLVTGGKSLESSGRLARVVAAIEAGGGTCQRMVIADEPSPEWVDEAVARYGGAGFGSVLAIGGGSVLDAGKAIAGLLATGRSVMDFLEGVGRGMQYAGPAIPLVAVPTTAGTGSEATKNAVLSRRGPTGFKKSFRDDKLVAAVAAVDPDLLEGAPGTLLAANGMDALTQLLESYTSTRANPMTDALAWSGMERFQSHFFPFWRSRGCDAKGRSAMAYASLQSGICLAQTGLGAVHGMAAALGALAPIPHGVVCGTLLAETTAINIAALRTRAPESVALNKYAKVANLLSGREDSLDRALDGLVANLRDWKQTLSLPGLGRYGLGSDHWGKIVAESRGSSMKTNPLPLLDEELVEILNRCV
ncbi:MAG: iron-containing alcohol dehydrogenase [Magnetococcales bacterium]|nr:iron-containing alcohol dehydrogenase [Magnetococcales bacterium]MBF0151221.1 iron-containing alcohol dehydrogenase [Magnetococcales bacterium]MBF0175160.1 iron-containing alcohol dehydrogenase [Magnetococcales bacterium]MBF0348827.1 iron-containing alcohol dehydrogenase [Magnetococcales bacterium]